MSYETHKFDCDVAYEGGFCTCGKDIKELSSELTELKAELNDAKNKAQVMFDLHAALGVRWGDNPYLRIDQLKKAESEISALKARCEEYEKGLLMHSDIRVAFMADKIKQLEAELAVAKEVFVEQTYWRDHFEERFNNIISDRPEVEKALREELSETQAKLEEAEHELAIECDWHNDTLKKFAAQEKVVEGAKPYLNHKWTCSSTVPSFTKLCDCGFKAFLDEVGKI